jgi:hypothetical protein
VVLIELLEGSHEVGGDVLFVEEYFAV